MKLRWRIAWLCLYPWLRPILNLRVHGRRNLVPGPKVLAVNHTCNADPILVGLAAACEIHFLAKQELFDYRRWFTWLIRTWNAWPVRRGGADASAIRRCSWLLRNRQTVVLFPEGTRSPSGELQQFRPGIGLLAIQNRVPIVPTHMSGVSRSFVSYIADKDFVRRGCRTRPTRPVPICIRFGEPVRPDGFSDDRPGHVALTQAVEDRIRALAAQ
jgi:1-acyl-sn-glycerol-3-phosphate acyltransferase